MSDHEHEYGPWKWEFWGGKGSYKRWCRVPGCSAFESKPGHRASSRPNGFETK